MDLPTWDFGWARRWLPCSPGRVRSTAGTCRTPCCTCSRCDRGSWWCAAETCEWRSQRRSSSLASRARSRRSVWSPRAVSARPHLHCLWCPIALQKIVVAIMLWYVLWVHVWQVHVVLYMYACAASRVWSVRWMTGQFELTFTQLFCAVAPHLCRGCSW